MEGKTDWIQKRQVLRTDAERLLAGIINTVPASQPSEILLHELAVHKVELETQIEELRRAHEAMEEARDRYVDFYDFSPVGYITLNRDGLIGEVNLTGSTLLGMGRAALVNRRFSTFVSPADRDRWHRMLMTMVSHTGIEKQTIALEMVRDDGTTFPAHLDCRCRKLQELPLEFRVTLIDVGTIRQTEANMQSVPPEPSPLGG